MPTPLRCWIITASLMVVGAVAFVHGADVLKDLGVKEADARNLVVEALNSGAAPWSPAIKTLKSATPAVRVTMVQGLLAWTKAYTRTDTFKQAYAEVRTHNKPDAPEPAGTYADQLKKQRDDMEKSIAEMQKNMASLPPETRKQVEDSLKATRAQFEASAKDPKMNAMMEAAYKDEQKNKQHRYEQQVKEWEQRYPVNPDQLIARRLQAFLNVTADVDFTAKLVANGARKRFADAKYEEKPPEWKLAFRAGREAVDAARTLAAAWLKELPTP
jgi:hypothetical protein